MCVCVEAVMMKERSFSLSQLSRNKHIPHLCKPEKDTTLWVPLKEFTAAAVSKDDRSITKLSIMDTNYFSLHLPTATIMKNPLLTCN